VSFSFFFFIIILLLLLQQLLLLLFIPFSFSIWLSLLTWVVKADELFCRPQKKKMNNLSQLLAFVNGARHVGLYILSSPDLSLCLAGQNWSWSSSTREEELKLMNHQIRNEKKNLSGEIEREKGVDPNLLTYFDSTEKKANLKEILFVCFENSPPPFLQCRVR
jgi:hypothetical protein